MEEEGGEQREMIKTIRKVTKMEDSEKSETNEFIETKRMIE